MALRYCLVLTTEPDGRLAAIVDFTFNLGAGRLQASTVRRRVNQRDWAGAAQELRRWVYGGGRSNIEEFNVGYQVHILAIATTALSGAVVFWQEFKNW